MDIGENEFRDILFEEYKESISSLITGRRNPIGWSGNEFPPISFLLQQKTEEKINKIVNELIELKLIAKELPLKKEGEFSTRIDLLGNSELSGLTILELKKSKQTERQSFTELLAYANYFCSLFPSLRESTITSILIAPMQSRTVRDAFAHELAINNKNVISLIPSLVGDNIELEVHYPDNSYYKWFENNIFNDKSMSVVAISFSEIKGWIDTDKKNSGHIPFYSESTLNSIANLISHKLESLGIHAMVYASQKWGELAQVIPYPNTIYIVATNPFSSFRSTVNDSIVTGNTMQARIDDIQYVYDNLHEDNKKFWLDSLESNFRERLITVTKNEFLSCFKSKSESDFDFEISLPSWEGLKLSMVDAVFVHNLDIHLTGLFREVFNAYISFMYESGSDAIFYGDDLPMFSYDALREFLPVWTILRGIGFGDKST